MKKNHLLALGIIVACSSCASIVSHSKWPLSINSSPAGAWVTITNRANTVVFRGKTPTSAILKSGSGFFRKETYKIHLEMEGYDQREVTVDCHMNGWYWGNFAIGGALGFLIIDPATGAMYRLDREAISETLSKTTASVKQEPQLNICSINDLPTNMKGHLVELK